jgi:RHS repeat-associated protein
MSRPAIASIACLMTLLAGSRPLHAGVSSAIGTAFVSASLLAVPPIPVQPKPFTIPAQPIVAASTNGYLPSSWSVTPKGELSLILPLAVPPGRAGMAPSLSLEYSSSSGNGLAGVGWRVSGFSTITRGGRNWTRDGETDGVDFTPRDRFYLDGEELVGVNATPYGGNGAEYRTEPDAFVRVHSTSALPLDPKGPEAFVVELGDGRVRTYAPLDAEQVTFDKDNKVFAHGPVHVEWRITSEEDAYGNTIRYTYQDTAGPGGSNAADYWVESVPASIHYTGNFSKGQPRHGLQDLPQRTVVFEYEPRVDASAGWQAGVQRRHSLRLKTTRMDAPNPTVTAPVWQYTLSYTMSGSQRSLLQSVQRCEAAGGCLWAKAFTYSPSTQGTSFQSQPIVPAPIDAAAYDLGLVSAADGETPALVTLDLNGDGASDLLFGPGATKLWEQSYDPPPFDIWVPDGNFLGGGHSLWLSERDANGVIVPFGQGLSLARDEEPLAGAHYGHVRLDEATAVDLDGDGRDELVAAIDNLGSHEISLDPNLPPLYGCSFATLAWTAAGFEHRGATPCTPLGAINKYMYYLPNEFPTYADFNGDGLPDRASSYNTAGWIGSNNPNDKVEYELDPAWQVALNETLLPGNFGPPTKYAGWPASPGVVTDFDGDGRAELTSEAEKTSLGQDDNGKWVPEVPDSVHLPLDNQAKPEDGYREFGDFNGDGTEDLLRLTVSDPARPGTLTGQFFWNTGKGFYADAHTRTITVDVHPDRAHGLATRFADPGIHVTDLDNDGRMDVVVFQNDPAAEVVLLYSQGDGTFAETDLHVQSGTRDDVKYWLDDALRPIHYYPGRLEHDAIRTSVAAVGTVFPPAAILLGAVPFQEYVVVGPDQKTPGFAAGWNLATLADTNGDGAIDIVRHVGGNDASGGFEVLAQTPTIGDELIAVTDEAAPWPALSIDYSSTWSDRPEADDSYACSYPLHCPKSGLRVVRRVTSRSALADLKPGDNPDTLGRTWEWSYRDPVAHAHLGFFGFSEVRQWDRAPEHPVETITTYDLRMPDASGRFYPGVGVPATVTVAQPILAPNAGQPSSAPARLTKTAYTHALFAFNGGATHAVQTTAVETSQWEEPVAIAWSGNGPDHRHVSGYAEPASPPLHVDTQLAYDDDGQVIDTITQTAKGLKTEVQTPRINDTVNWHLGLVSERSVMTLESAKEAVPVWQTTAYTYTSEGDLESVMVEPNGDPALQATTTLSYDDYGLVTGMTTTAPGEAPRTRHVDYANAWPGAPDEHLFARVAWAEHDHPLCVTDCRPATWVLTHPAYGLAVATMDRLGAQTVQTYDAHGRPILTQSDGGLPVSVTYAGRPDAFGGMNGLQATATSGLQQVMKTYDVRGATLRTSFVGFDGQWINTFARYDALGRRTGLSRPNAGPALAWTNTDYDSLGRATAINYPDGSHATTTYGLLETEHVDPAGHYSHQQVDVDGRLVESGTELPPDPGCGVCLGQVVKATYAYGATSIGPVDTVLDDQGNAVVTQHDRRGRPIAQDDPTTGTTKVTYNGFGEMKSTLHVATGELETQTHDDLGRTLTTTTPDGLTTFMWDVATNGIGRLASAMSSDQIKTAYRYDGLGRTIGLDQTANGATLSLDMGFDAQTGRLATLDYPQAPGQAARLRAGYAYNGYGYLASVSDATPGGSGTVWQTITARNADLAYVDGERGIEPGIGGAAISDHREYDPLTGRLWNLHAAHAVTNLIDLGYNYDADGLVAERITTNAAVQIDETFAHDALHRLTHATRSGMPLQNGMPFSTTTDETYDTLGNRIDTLKNGQLVEHRSYGANASPYALTERTIMDPKNPPDVQTISYDALGRLAQDPHRAFKWTAFDLPKSVTENGATWTFAYDASHARVTKAGPKETITSFGGLYEKHEGNSATRHVYHLVGSDEPIGEIVYTESGKHTQPGTTTLSYALTDALGSTLAVTDASGTVSETDYYDLWGQRTKVDGSPLDQPTLFQSLISAGFTSQPHDDDLALINMQGRLYDPALGRFLSADPIVGNAAFSQSWNAYSYVGNSPTDFVDPSGFECTTGITTVSADGKSVSTTTACHDDGSNEGADVAIRSFSGIDAMLDDLTRLAKQRQAVERAKGHVLNGVRVRASDGTPLPTRRVDHARGVVTDNWGKPVYPLKSENPRLNYTDHPAAKYIARAAKKLACGKDCSDASAPSTAREATEAPKQLSDGKLVRNAVSQAVAARAFRKWIAKVGLFVDEGIDGAIDRLMPNGMGVDDDEDEIARDIAQRIAEGRATLAQTIELAEQNFRRSEAAYLAAVATRDRLHQQYLMAESDLRELDPSDVAIDLFTQVLRDSQSEYERAVHDATASNFRAQVDFDWWQRLRARFTATYGDP